jgi:epoxyqueuosine reductase QueG
VEREGEEEGVAEEREVEKGVVEEREVEKEGREVVEEYGGRVVVSGEERDGRGEEEKEERKGEDKEVVVVGFGEISRKRGVWIVGFEEEEDRGEESEDLVGWGAGVGWLGRAGVICTWDGTGYFGFLYKLEYILFTTVLRRKLPLDGTLAPKPTQRDAIFRVA